MAVRRKSGRVAALPVPDAVSVLDGEGGVVAWDLRATGEFLREQGWMSDCDEECRRRNCVAPVSRGVFREVVGASPGVASFDEVVVRRWLDEHPNPLVVVPGRGAYEPRDGATVSDVVRAAIR